jgi:hypothetical protein
MSYLGSPRIHFAGRFQADPPTANNDVRHYDAQMFHEDFQEPMVVKDEKIVWYRGYWNPRGSGAFRLLGCKVTAAVLDGQLFHHPEDDPAIGLIVGGANDRVAAKIVDLDPQQHMVSQIWGLCIALQDVRGVTAFSGEFEVTAFCDLWMRGQQKSDTVLDLQLAAVYQSVLTQMRWLNFADSRCLKALKERSDDGILSVRMNLFGFDCDPASAAYGTGTVVGTIGPAWLREPKHFVLGRQLIAALDASNSSYPFVPANSVSNAQAEINEQAQTVTVDLGNAFPITDPSGTLQKIGVLALAVLKDPGTGQGASVSGNQIELLGPIPYEDADWHFKTAGVQEFPCRKGSTAAALVRDHPLALVRQDTPDQYTIVNRETGDGLYVRADTVFARLNPGDQLAIDFYASKYGQGHETTVLASPTSALMGGPGTAAKLPPSFVVPDVAKPAGIVQFPSEFTTDASGRGRLSIAAASQGPGNPRQYIDGQLYAISYQIKELTDGSNPSPFQYISVLAWDRYEVPEAPTWFEHIRPILSLYGNLYPIMSQRLIDLSDYDSVVAKLEIMRLSLALPLTDPNSMPVTRDLSANKRITILKWLDAKDPVTKLPPRGQPPAIQGSQVRTGKNGENEKAAGTPHLAGKVEFVKQALKAGK